jgi:N-acetylmuramate 1-kinase
MKPEHSELFLVEELVKKSIEKGKIELNPDFQVDKLTGDASTRRYYRIIGSTESFVVCVGDPGLKGSVESTFVKVQKALEENGVRVPKIYDNDLPRGYLLQEDLGDCTFLKTLATINDKSDEYNLYEKAIDAMITMHRLDLSKYPQESFNVLSFDFNKLSDEIDFSIRNFIFNYLGVNLSENDLKAMKKDLYGICDILGKAQMVFTHRDYHSRNIMIKNGELVIIDIQDARRGIPQYDLVSLLEDCYYDLDSQNLEKCKKLYFENFLKENKIQTDYNEFHHYYDLMSIQRIFKAIGSFSYIFKVRGDSRYLKYIGYGFERLRGYLLNYPEYKNLRILLSSTYYGN